MDQIHTIGQNYNYSEMFEEVSIDGASFTSALLTITELVAAVVLLKTLLNGKDWAVALTALTGKAVRFSSILKYVGAVCLIIFGVAELVKGALSAWTEGIDWGNFTEMLIGIAGVVGGIAILFGANVGTCSTVPLLLALPQITSDLRIYFALILIIGLIVRRTRPLVGAIAGLFLMIEGFSLLRSGSASLVAVGDLFTYLHAPDTSPPIAITIGIVLTFVLQSASSATLLLTSLAEEHLFSLHTVCYIIYGNNIGSCLSSVLASLAATHEARMTALANLILNIGGVLLFLPLTSPLLALVTALTPITADRLVILHTVFNLVGSLLLLPFVKQYATLIRTLYPFKCT